MDRGDAVTYSSIVTISHGLGQRPSMVDNLDIAQLVAQAPRPVVGRDMSMQFATRFIDDNALMCSARASKRTSLELGLYQ